MADQNSGQNQKKNPPANTLRIKDFYNSLCNKKSYPSLKLDVLNQLREFSKNPFESLQHQSKNKIVAALIHSINDADRDVSYAAASILCNIIENHFCSLNQSSQNKSSKTLIDSMLKYDDEAIQGVALRTISRILSNKLAVFELPQNQENLENAINDLAATAEIFPGQIGQSNLELLNNLKAALQ